MNNILRKLQNLYLGSMPGWHYSFNDWLKAINEMNIKKIVCLVSDQEIEAKSPEYAQWKKNNSEFDFYQFPIPDFGIPDKNIQHEFWELGEDISKLNQNGTPVFIHCAGGIGRTGMFASAVLMFGGISIEEAIKEVKKTGSGPETPVQASFLKNSYIKP
ncbi:MAG: dual specificity protein phosphatase family protein [Spirochaetia bacterium]|jgi:protein-tyrosine phosphatase|nr:dual specificity protein phosphatase family protein [Spirochaetia bacterium]